MTQELTDLVEEGFFDIHCFQCDKSYDVRNNLEKCPHCSTALTLPESQKKRGVVSFYEDLLIKIEKYHLITLKNCVCMWFLAGNTGWLGYEMGTRPLPENFKPNPPQVDVYINTGLAIELSLETAVIFPLLGWGSIPFVVVKLVGTNAFGYAIGRVAKKHEQRTK